LCLASARRERRHLAAMSERTLRAVGPSRHGPLKEWEKPFWRL
jgi:uncharacterized protein YjiS (DUF1127 family)